MFRTSWSSSGHRRGLSLFDTLHLRKQYGALENMDPHSEPRGIGHGQGDALQEIEGKPQPFIADLLQRPIEQSDNKGNVDFTYSVELVPPVRLEHVPRFLERYGPPTLRPSPLLFVSLARKADVTQNEATLRPCTLRWTFCRHRHQLHRLHHWCLAFQCCGM